MGLKKYIITGHVIEVYEYKNYIHGKGGQEFVEKLVKKINKKTILIQTKDAVILLEDWLAVILITNMISFLL